MVNERFAQNLLENENPIGLRVRGGGRVYEIIGVVKNTKSRTIGEDLRPVLYRSLAQDIGPDPSMSGYTVLVRVAGDPGAGFGNAVRAEIRRRWTGPCHLRRHHDGAAPQRSVIPRPGWNVRYSVSSAYSGLSLAAVGLYGVISYWVSRRTREIGIRLAIGARVGEVQRLIIRQGMTLAGAALIPGLAAAWGTTKLFTSFLYGVPAHDAVTFTLVPLFLVAVAFLACWIPSRRAAKVDPKHGAASRIMLHGAIH